MEFAEKGAFKTNRPSFCGFECSGVLVKPWGRQIGLIAVPDLHLHMPKI